MNLRVECYAGYMAEQEPRRFQLGSEPIEVEAVLDRWSGPDHRYFKVKGHDQSQYILRYDIHLDQWDLAASGTSFTVTKRMKPMTALRNEHISAGPCRINRIQHPAGTKKPIILLHGAKFEADTWLQLGTLERLSKADHPVHALDMPGFGKSESCAAQETEVIAAYIRQENLDKPVLIGPSRGGRFALEFNFAYPELLGGLILVGTVGVQENKSRFKDISVPCLLIWGSEDTISDPQNGYLLNREIPDSELLILEGAPHPCYLEKTEEFHQAVIAFLNERYA